MSFRCSYALLPIILIFLGACSKPSASESSQTPKEPEAPPIRISSADPTASTGNKAEPKPEPKQEADAPEKASTKPEDKPSPFGGSAGPAKKVQIAAGTYVGVRLSQSLSPSRNKTGDKFQGTLDQPIWAGGRIVAAKGAKVTGIITDLKPGGRSPEFSISLTALETDSGRAVIRTGDFTLRPRRRDGADPVIPADTRAGFKLQSAVTLN